MLTQRHLSVIRAALRFWSEEMQPYDSELMSAYCDRAESDDDFPYSEDVQWITDHMDQLDLRFILIDAARSSLISDHVFSSVTAAQQALGTTKGEVAAMLVLRD